MRPAVVSPLIAPLLLALAGCSADAPDGVFIHDFVERSSPLKCQVVDFGTPPATVIRLKAVNDSLLAVIAEGDQEILILSHDLALVARVRYGREGPSALLDPRDVILLGDTLLVVADRARARLKFMDLGGRDHGTLDLGFPPHRMVRHGDGYLVSAMLLFPTQGELLFHAAEGSVRGLGVRPAHVADWQLKTMANLAVLEDLGHGRVVLAHQFIEATAHLLDFSGDGAGPPDARRVPVPLPDGAGEAVGYLPKRPFTEDALMRVVTPMLDAASDPVSGELVYMTRTGRRIEDHWEKALVRVDRNMRYLDSHLMPANVGPFAYLSRRNEIIAVAEDELWYRCALPERVK